MAATDGHSVCQFFLLCLQLLPLQSEDPCGGAGGAANADEARRRVMDDFRDKSLENRAIDPGDLAYGFLFFPGEAQSAQTLRLQLIEEDTGERYTVNLAL